MGAAEDAAGQFELDRGNLDQALTHSERALQLIPAQLSLLLNVAYVHLRRNENAAAGVIRGRKVSPGLRAIVVPGSARVKAEAEAEGLDEVFMTAGFEWRSAGCSMCLGMNGDILAPRERSASTSNRNFEGRQGPGGRTHLVSPAMAAATAVAGRFAAPSDLEGGR